MKNYHGKLAALLFLSLWTLFGMNTVSMSFEKGIYINQTTLENTKYFTYLINRAKQVGINTFVVDLELTSRLAQKNLALLKENNIKYIARIIMFPGGGTPEQIASETIRDKKYKLIQAAISYGAQQIQLDYIRYNTKQPASPEHAQTIHKLLQWYKTRLAKQNIPMQIDVFGIASYGEEQHIGHNVKLFSETIDALCPMVYPSHYEPFRQHAVTPYKTVYESIQAIKSQFDKETPPFKLYPYIELSNYRYPLSQDKKLVYIYAQIKAVEESNADGWFAWSPNNYYDNLFRVLEKWKVK
jgi:hypothetical protein